MMHRGALPRLTIVGTMHVDKSSVERVRRTIAEIRPSVVAVELDEERLRALRDSERAKLHSPLHSGLLPWLLELLERTVGSVTEVFPGSEMLEAVEEGHRVEANVVMIDRPISAILEEVRGIPFLEKFRIGVDAVMALVSIGTGRRKTRPVGADLDNLMREFDAKYPTLSRILVKERDRYMADRLQEIVDSTTGQVVAVVGFGHVRGITGCLAEQVGDAGGKRIELNYRWTLGAASP